VSDRSASTAAQVPLRSIRPEILGRSGKTNLFAGGRATLAHVYGPRESHKGGMASVPFHQYRQFQANGKVELFGGYDGYANGAQMRDFVYIDDVVDVNLFFLDGASEGGIYNVGTGRAQQFNDIALAVVTSLFNGDNKLSLADLIDRRLLEYLPFPEKLKGKYQSFTCADISELRRAGFANEFRDVRAGVARYMAWLSNT
jgi:ADP-L-glycero-D-manno-heptose 6-epimerase